MNRKFFYVLTFVCLLTKIMYSQPLKILYIGNSYTYYNSLPQTINDIALSKGDSVLYDVATVGGYSFINHTTDGTTLSKINSQPWDYVVLQEQSQRPALNPTYVASQVYPYASFLDSLIVANDSCSETMFYMTWGRQYGDASNCPTYPPVCTYNGMQQRLRESYLQMALDNHGSISPVGVAWKYVRDYYPGINLYDPDQSHPSPSGSYLAACVFYSSFFHKSSVGSFFPSTVSAADALILQSVGSTIVLDSLSLWQGNGDIPIAEFSSSPGATSNLFNFVNSSCASCNTLLWDFGDGSTTTSSNPSHTYSSIGQNVITLTVSNGCKTFSTSDTVDILSTEISEKEESFVKIYPNPSSGEVFIEISPTSSIEFIQITNALGEMVLEIYDVGALQNKIKIKPLDNGIYFINIFDSSSEIITKKVIIY